MDGERAGDLANSPGRSGAAIVTYDPLPRTTTSPPSRAWVTRSRCRGGKAPVADVGAPPVRVATRVPTRSVTRPAFHALHAAGPGGQRVGLGEGVQQFEGARVAEGGGHPPRWRGRPRRGGWRRRPAAGGDARGPPARRRRRAGSPSGRRRCRPPHAGEAVVVAQLGGKPLPMSCSQVPTSSRSGRLTRPTRAPAPGRRLAQVPVDGEAVVGVALGRLRTAAHSGSIRTSRPFWSRASSTAMAGRPAPSSVHQRTAGLVGPRVAGADRLDGQALEGGPAQGGPGRGRRRRRPQDQHRVAGGVGVGRQLHPPVPQHQPRPEGSVPAATRPSGPRSGNRCGPTCRRSSRRWCGRPPPPGP